MLKRIKFGLAVLRAQMRLFLAEIHHYSARRIVSESREEMERAVELMKFTRQRLLAAKSDADLAQMQVRRHSQRRAMGLR